MGKPHQASAKVHTSKWGVISVLEWTPVAIITPCHLKQKPRWGLGSAERKAGTFKRFPSD